MGWYFRSDVILYCTEVLAALTFFSTPAFNALVSNSVNAEMQGFALGTLTAVNGLGTMVGPLAFGIIYARFREEPFNAPWAAFLFGTALAFAALLLTLTKLRRTSSTWLEPATASANTSKGGDI